MRGFEYSKTKAEARVMQGRSVFGSRRFRHETVATIHERSVNSTWFGYEKGKGILFMAN